MDIKNWRPAVALAAVFLVIAVIVDRGFSGSALFDFELRDTDYLGLFTHLIIVTIIVERSVEVFNAIWRRAGREQLELEIQSEPDNKKRLKKELELNAYRSLTRQRAMYIAFTAGLAVALAGVNILNVLFDASELPRYQFALFKATDIFVTAGLIAGGSKALNETIGAIGDALAKRTPSTAGTPPNPASGAR